MKHFFGKYRGKVLNNVDPLQLGRVQVSVAALPAPTNWAMPCAPFAGMLNGFYVVPPLGANVWVEFEGGDPDAPIVSGYFWGVGEVPSAALLSPPGVTQIALQTTLMNSLVISDVPGPTGGIQIKAGTGAMILVNDVGITITNGQGATIMLAGTAVDVNQGGLTVLY
jgi:uncharacterized protein involved in type VI secretion and phage assembly